MTGIDMADDAGGLLRATAQSIAAAGADPRRVCDNTEGHCGDLGRPVATVKMTWPDGRFHPAYACEDCCKYALQIYVLESFEDGQRHPVLIEPVFDDV